MRMPITTCPSRLEAGWDDGGAPGRAAKAAMFIP